MDVERQQAITRAIGLHGKWKSRLRAAIEEGKSEYTVDSVSHDQNCEFGKWLYSDLVLKAETPAQYEKVRGLHSEFHQEVGKVLALALKGRKQEALRAFETDGPFTTLSSALTLEMMAWRKA